MRTIAVNVVFGQSEVATSDTVGVANNQSEEKERGQVEDQVQVEGGQKRRREDHEAECSRSKKRRKLEKETDTEIKAAIRDETSNIEGKNKRKREIDDQEEDREKTQEEQAEFEQKIVHFVQNCRHQAEAEKTGTELSRNFNYNIPDHIKLNPVEMRILLITTDELKTEQSQTQPLVRLEEDMSKNSQKQKSEV